MMSYYENVPRGTGVLPNMVGMVAQKSRKERI